MSMQAAADDAGKDLSPPRCCVAHAWLSKDVYVLLQRAADLRRIHVDELVRLIVMHQVDRVLRDSERLPR